MADPTSNNPPAGTPPADSPPERTYTRAELDVASKTAAAAALAERLGAAGLTPELFAQVGTLAKEKGWDPETWQTFLREAGGGEEVAEPKTDEGKRYRAEAQQLAKRLGETEQRLGALAAERDREAIRGELRTIAQKLQAVDPETVEERFLSRTKRLDGLTVVTGPKGETLPITPEDAVAEWLRANPARLQPSVRPGAGSRSPTGEVRAGAHMPPDEKAALATREGQIEYLQRVDIAKVLRGEN